MKVLVFLSDGFGGRGGIAQYNRDFLSSLCSHPRCSSVIALPRLMPDATGPLPAKLVYDPRGVGGKCGYALHAARSIAMNSGVDLIVCAHLNLLPLAYLAHLRFGAPILLEIYGVDAWQPTANRLVDYLARRVDMVVSISELTLKRFQEWTGFSSENTALLPNAIHLEQYGTGERRRDLAERYGIIGKTVILTLGRMNSAERYKGFDEVLELLPALAGDIPDIVYLVVGDGDDRQRLSEKARSLGVADRLVMTGYVDEQEKADHYRLADAYVMPSYGEGFGFVVLEALACGIPVVASTLDGTREATLNGSLGILVDPRESAAIRDAIVRSVNMPKRIHPGLEYFSFDNFTRRVHGVLDGIFRER